MKTFILFLVFLIPISICGSENQVRDDRQLELIKEMQMQQLNGVKQKLQNMKQKFDKLIEDRFAQLETRLVGQLRQSLDELRNTTQSALEDEISPLIKELQEIMDVDVDDSLTPEISNISTTEDPQIDNYIPHKSCLNCSKHGCFPTESLVGLDPYHMICDKGSHGSGWIIIQRRMDGSEDFYWHDYIEGFGDYDTEFWLGLDAIHQLITTLGPVELLIEMVKVVSGEIKYAKYSDFAIGDESEQYNLKTLGDYEGNAGDALSCHKGYNFSTAFKDNDFNYEVERYGGWWFGNCSASNLNGCYNDKKARKSSSPYYNMYWGDYYGYDYLIRVSQMLIRPRNAKSKYLKT